MHLEMWLISYSSYRNDIWGKIRIIVLRDCVPEKLTPSWCRKQENATLMGLDKLTLLPGPNENSMKKGKPANPLHLSPS